MQRKGGTLRFVEGCGFEEFSRYLVKTGQHASKGAFEWLKGLLDGKRLNLIVFTEGNEIIGHAIWHGSNTEAHRKGEPRDKEDTEALERLLGGKKSFVELHEIWLVEEHRGRGYGREFFEFFEGFIKNKGYCDVVSYADHPAALAIFRKRGYKEGGYLRGAREYVFCLSSGKENARF